MAAGEGYTPLSREDEVPAPAGEAESELAADVIVEMGASLQERAPLMVGEGARWLSRLVIFISSYL